MYTARLALTRRWDKEDYEIFDLVSDLEAAEGEFTRGLDSKSPRRRSRVALVLTSQAKGPIFTRIST
jgi:hypothetical protein